MGKRKRGTKTERLQRVELAVACLREGIPPTQICQLLIKKESVSERTAWRILKDAEDYIEDLGCQTIEKQNGILTAQIEHLIRKIFNSDNPNYDQIIKLFELKRKMIHSKHISGKINGTSENYQHSRDSLSPKLAEALTEFLGGGDVERPDH